MALPITWIVTERFMPGAGPWLALIAGLAISKQSWPSRASVDAWAVGAKGEEKTERTLAQLGDGFRVFHDRRIPGTRANIDHIVVGPTGVFVVETKNVAGRVTIRGGELFVSGRRRQAFVEEAWREATTVQTALSEMLASRRLDVLALLCIHRADLPWGSTVVQGVPLVSPRGLLRAVKEGPHRLNADQVSALAVAIDTRLPPA